VTAPATEFKNWLIVQLQRTRWVKLKEPPERTAERLGVTLEVLLEAQRQYAENVKRGQLGFRLAAESTEVFIKAPEFLYGAWTERCKDMKLECAPVLRTLIHELLLSRYNPPKCYDREWVVLGKRYPMRVPANKAWPWRLRTFISRGAKSALRIRADRARVTETALMRSQVIEFLEGNIRRMPHVITPEQMHMTAEKYFLGEKL